MQFRRKPVYCQNISWNEDNDKWCGGSKGAGGEFLQTFN